jgi:pyrimidine operon attenuation protein/uracil phosphoribosyltransferase
MKQQQILKKSDVDQKIIRMACQISEENYNESMLIFLGIAPSGYTLAEKLCDEVKNILKCSTSLHKITLDKKNPLRSTVSLDPSFNPEKHTVILVDDVANTGKTIFYALQPLMNYNIKKLQVAVLVDRQHKLFPVSPDFVGLSLSTTLREHIIVNLEAEKEAVYLT